MYSYKCSIHYNSHKKYYITLGDVQLVLSDYGSVAVDVGLIYGKPLRYLGTNTFRPLNFHSEKFVFRLREFLIYEKK